ncbi:cell wall-binding repeat-containing protein [Clostridium sp. A1-XYC3]|uniref:Cell wall-binding repeat-containing protein n=1 Tax=Clostridium tanneri TaxID=3037988 RepID=A0ABU4JUI0_9CLOT|nr:cell wall-binding repeat-containing protein [Clostridium sp. A1-XYC3]MDW8801808.1 cell wall-binding repeat-containing protein [Clostridium sp. A1-XYC3]
MNKKILATTTALVAIISATVCTFNIKSVKADTTTLISSTQENSSNVKRITGADYYTTATAVSQAGWTTSDDIILASSANFPDALSGTSLGINLNAPILFTSKDTLNENTLNEIKRLNAKKVYILGGTESISQSVEDGFKVQGLVVTRLSGNDRFATAVAVGNEVISKSKSTTAFLSNAYGFADALASSSFTNGSPILLTDKDSLNANTKQALSDWGIKKVYILGGTGVVSQQVEDELGAMGISVTRLGGADRYGTAQKIVSNFDSALDKFTLTTGKDFHNALVASVYANKTNHPIMLMDTDCSTDVKNFVKDKDLVIVGNDIDESTLNNVNPITSNPADWVCPQIKSTATSDVEGDFAVLDKELGFGHGQSWAGYSLFKEHPINTNSTVITVGDEVNYGKTYNSQIMIQIDAWNNDPNIEGSYKAKPIAQQLFKFYFPNDYMTLYNIFEKDFSANLNKIIKLDNREVLITRPADSVMVWVSAPGEHLRTTP